MNISKTDIIEKIRIAIDEILPSGVTSTDTFWEDQDTEIWQAVKIAAEQLSMELPRELLEPTSVESATVTTDTESSDKYLELEASEYLALYSLKMSDWKTAVISTLAEGSAEALQQLNKWTCGTIWKPRVVETRVGDKVRLYCYSVTDEATVSRMQYIPRPHYQVTEGAKTVDEDTLVTGLQQGAESYLIYRAGRLILTAKKETELAEQMDGMSRLGG